LSVLFQVVFPVFLVFSAGFAGQKIFGFQIRSLSTAALYLMLPALVFRIFYETRVSSTYLHILVYIALLCLSLIILVKIWARIKGYDSATTSALILATAFMNNGNMGIPIILFAFGEEGVRYAISIMVFHVIMMSTLGIYYAAKGRTDVRASMISVLKMPLVHAGVLGLVWQYFSLPVPENIFKTIQLVGDAAIPVIMLVLGMQLAEIRLLRIEWGKTGLALLTRLAISPMLAWGIVLLLPVSSLLSKVMIVEAAMPTAAITTIYALQYDTRPELVSAVTLISSLLSMVTLSVLLNLLV